MLRFKELSKETMTKIYKQLLLSNYGIPNNTIQESCYKILMEEFNNVYKKAKKSKQKKDLSDVIYNRSAGQERGE